MIFEILILAWDRHNNVVRLNLLMGSQLFPLVSLFCVSQLFPLISLFCVFTYFCMYINSHMEWTTFDKHGIFKTYIHKNKPYRTKTVIILTSS